MAHSNRTKLRDGRGGMTRNQQKKARRMAVKQTKDPAARIKELEEWVENRNKKVDAPTVSGRNRRSISMLASAKRRRKSALGRLETQHAAGLRNEVANFAADRSRIEREMNILRNRI